MRVTRLLGVTALITLFAHAGSVNAADVNATGVALRLSNTITGGYLSPSDPLFQQMVAKATAGDVAGAAALAANSKYFANYLARRLAFQMQNPALDASSVTDSDATTFLIAKFTGAGGVKPSISSIWSENATYLVNVNGVQTRAAALTPAQLATVDWMSQIVQVPGQTAKQQNGNTFTPIAIPEKHVGGYITLSDRGNDNSYAQWGAKDGTNLRYIEGVWEISSGLDIADFMSSQAPTSDVPRFVPQYDPAFFQAVGQPACIACHGGGLPSITHGYSTLADTFNFDANQGLVYYPTPTTATRKSLGSDATKRQQILTCNLQQTPTAVCNPDSSTIDPNQGWDLRTFASSGVLNKLGWKGPTSGQGFNELGRAVGMADATYEQLVRRVTMEICPMGMLSDDEVKRIAKSANPNASPAGTDDIRTIVVNVASHASCL